MLGTILIIILILLLLGSLPTWPYTGGFVAPTAGLHAEAVADRLPRPFGNRPRLGIIVNMRVIAADLPGLGEALYHAGLLRRSGRDWVRRSPARYPSPARAPAASG